jgi:hypothetical protein
MGVSVSPLLVLALPWTPGASLGTGAGLGAGGGPGAGAGGGPATGAGGPGGEH